MRIFSALRILYVGLILLTLYLIWSFRFEADETNFLPIFSNATEVSIDLTFRLNPKTKVYQLHGKPIIWQYWHLDHVPLYVRLFVNAMQCRNLEFKVVLVQDSTIRQFLPDFFVPPETFSILSPKHRADLFRLAILERYGGVWADVDIMPLDKLYPMYELLTRYDIVTPNWGREKVSICLLGPMRSGLAIIREWHKSQKEKIAAKKGKIKEANKKYPFDLPELSGYTQYALVKELNKKRTKYKAYNGYTTVGQLVLRGLAHSGHVPFNQVSRKFLPLKWSPVLYLHHQVMQKLFWDINEMKMLLPNETTLYSTFVGCALLDCDEEYWETQNYHLFPSMRVNATGLLGTLQNFNRSVCDVIRNYQRVNFDKELIDYH